eukprot:GEMP01077094.1.p1 GENE.GEMP01077094.1~~GEMP01077094.1.p1  ORF type:complete len:188 (+),score=33.95 GEMP01077094.1:77-640(+)
MLASSSSYSSAPSQFKGLPQEKSCGSTTDCAVLSSALMRTASSTPRRTSAFSVSPDTKEDMEAGRQSSWISNTAYVDGWLQVLDPEGRPFWLCEETQEVSWTLPGEEWTASWDKFGSSFWVNKEGYMIPRANNTRVCNASTQTDRQGALELRYMSGFPSNATSMVVAIATFFERTLSSLLARGTIRA